MKQLNLFENMPSREVFGVAYGVGVDSTAMLIGLHTQGIRPDFILFADVGSEKFDTYLYLPIIQEWLRSVGFPAVTVVRYVPPKAPYTTIEGNCTMNATLPGATFNRGSCTMKWKISPQDRWTARNDQCLAAWAGGKKVTKWIGFDASEGYRQLRANDKAHAGDSDRYNYEYPLISWGWDREECKARIREAGLPVPLKSACVICPNTKPHELEDMTEDDRGRIVRMEVVAGPYNKKVHGLWRRPRKRDDRPGSITEYMIKNNIPFTLPKDLPDEMPMNPACAKNRRGWTFQPPHDAPDLAAMVSDLENRAHWDLIDAA